MNKKVILKQRPVGEPKLEDFELFEDLFVSIFAFMIGIVDLEVIVLGGSVAEGLSQFYWKDILDRTSHYAIPFYKKNPPIKMTALGDDASILGA